MDSEPTDRRSVRLQLLLIATIFGVPLLLAAWMYYSGSVLVPRNSTNSGAILEPIVSLAGTLPQSEIHKVAPDQWLMLYVNTQPCDDTCSKNLLRLRQIRLMLGNDMNRLSRVFLHGDSVPDTVLMHDLHAGLKTITDNDLSVALEGKRPKQLRPGGIYLIDPLGNLVMYFAPELNPKAVADDIEHLLKLSHIG